MALPNALELHKLQQYQASIKGASSEHQESIKQASSEHQESMKQASSEHQASISCRGTSQWYLWPKIRPPTRTNCTQDFIVICSSEKLKRWFLINYVKKRCSRVFLTRVSLGGHHIETMKITWLMSWSTWRVRKSHGNVLFTLCRWKNHMVCIIFGFDKCSGDFHLTNSNNLQARR